MKKIKLTTILTVSVATALFMQYVYAVGTPAGTVIQSRSMVVYSTVSGSLTDTVYSNYVSFSIAQIAAVNVTPPTNSSTTNGDSVYVTYAMTITNSGNGSDQFNLSSTSSKSWTRAFYFDLNGDGTLQSGELSAGTITQTGSIAADATYKIIVRLFVPKGPSLDGEIDTTSTTVTSVFDNSKSNIARVRTTVNTVDINPSSALTVLPTNPAPGQNVTYSMTLTNNGSVAATGVNFTDLINTGLFTYVSGSTTQGTFDGSSNPATWNVGTLNPGGSVTVTIVLQVNSGIPNGTPLDNHINVTYTVGGNTFTLTSNNPTGNVGVTRGVSISPTVLSSTNEADDTLAYAMTVKNTGNAKDIFEMSFSSTKSYSWTYFKDVNSNNTLDGGDTQLANTAGSPAGVDVDSVEASDSVKILARLIIPKVATDQTQDVATFTVTSAADASKTMNAVGTTTINIPVLDLTRTVSPTGNQPPGEEMTFQLAYQNNGHGKAYNVVFTESEPDSMTYVANSVTIDNVAKTDVADADQVTVTTVSGRKVITISVGTVNALSSQAIIRYRGTIH